MDEDVFADLFSAFGPVAARRLFGGRGLYADGLMFAIEVSGTIYLKADADFAADLAPRGAAPFSYVAKGVVRTLGGFWSVPEAALDDADELAALARRALACARNAPRKPARPSATKPGATKPGATKPARPKAAKTAPAGAPRRRKSPP